MSMPAIAKRANEEADTKKTLKQTVEKKLRPVVVVFVTIAIVSAFLFSLYLILKDTYADTGSKGSGRNSIGTTFHLESQAPVRGVDIEVSMKGASLSKGQYSYRWWLNGHLVEGYNKRIFPGMGLKKDDEVKVEVLNHLGKGVAKKTLLVVHSSLSLRS